MNRLALIETLKTIAQTAEDREFCGFVGIKPDSGDDFWHLYPLANRSPLGSSYVTDPNDQLDAFNRMQSSGVRLWGVYHTHKLSAAPSGDDTKWWRYPPELKQIIASPMEVKVYVWNGGGSLDEVSIP